MEEAHVGNDDVVIAVASYPGDLASWNQDEDPYYLEVFGEAEPVLDMAHAEVLPVHGATTQTSPVSPVYEYWWTVGHGGTKPEHHHLFENRRRALWDRLEDIAARVYLYFPIDGGWRIQEVAASTKYLAPVAHQSDWSEKAAADWQRMQPIVAGAGEMASALGVVPGVGTIAAGAAPILSAASKLRIGSVPQDVQGFNWYMEKVTFGAAGDHGVMQGVVWAIPKEMFESLGGRLVGSLAVSFIPTASGDTTKWEPAARSLLAHAVVYAEGKHSWVPGQSRFVELTLSPKPPA